ncbi:hypothetical protein [Brasilonema octagenarum]|nr:hypothetical protein [Brasilonema octagenarum]
MEATPNGHALAFGNRAGEAITARVAGVLGNGNAHSQLSVNA